MSGTEIKTLDGKGVYIKGNDIDTDRIIPARFLKCVTFDELGPSLFRDERFNPDGSSKNHVLDRPEHLGASILISDANFGCGSSREHAPQAIQKFGFKAVIAESFAEIFFGNCTTLGIPCVEMADESRQALIQIIADDPDVSVLIDLEGSRVICGNRIFDVAVKQSARGAFLTGTYDPLDELLASRAAIDQAALRLGYK